MSAAVEAANHRTLDTLRSAVVNPCCYFMHALDQHAESDANALKMSSALRLQTIVRCSVFRWRVSLLFVCLCVCWGGREGGRCYDIESFLNIYALIIML